MTTNSRAKPSFHQRRYLVDKRFQMKYTLLVVAFSAVLYAILGYMLYRKEVANSEILQIQNIELSRLIAAQDVNILYYLGAFFVIQVVSLFVLGILLTHRIAGPVYRIHRYLEEVAETGEIRALDPVRSRDEFTEFFDSLANVIGKLKDREEDRAKMLRELRDEVEKAGSEPASLERCRILLGRLLKAA